MIKTEGQDKDIGRCREAVAAFIRAHGQAPKACVVTFGCQMNTEPEIMKTRINKGFCKRQPQKRRAFSFCEKFFEHIT